MKKGAEELEKIYREEINPCRKKVDDMMYKADQSMKKNLAFKSLNDNKKRQKTADGEDPVEQLAVLGPQIKESYDRAYNSYYKKMETVNNRYSGRKWNTDLHFAGKSALIKEVKRARKDMEKWMNRGMDVLKFIFGEHDRAEKLIHQMYVANAGI